MSRLVVVFVAILPAAFGVRFYGEARAPQRTHLDPERANVRNQTSPPDPVQRPVAAVQLSLRSALAAPTAGPVGPRAVLWRPEPGDPSPFGYIPTTWDTEPQLLPNVWDAETVVASDPARR